MNELWLPVVGYEGLYEVSDQGRVRSLDRRVKHKDGRSQFVKGQAMASLASTNYRKLCLCRHGEVKTFSVHVIVAEAFHGKRPDGMVVNHIDENKLNNKASNLEWVTYKQNFGHSRASYSRELLKGSKLSYAKLNESQVRAIRLDRRTQREIAEEYGVSPGCIQHVRQRKSWKHVN